MPRRPIAEIRKEISSLRGKLTRAAKGAPVLTSIDEVSNTYFLRRPSGITNLDIDTGGGLPAGGLCYLSGPDNAGKTFLMFKYFAMVQRLYGERAAVALGVSESAPDHWFMRKCGMSVAIPDEMIEEEQKYRKEQGITVLTKEEIKQLKTQVGHVEIIRGETGEKLLQAILDCVDTKAFDIVGLDSVSALLSEDQAGKDMDENPQQAAVAGMLTRFFVKYLASTTGYHGKNETTVIFTAQARSNRRKSEMQSHIAKYMKEWASTGAYAARHGKLIDITVWSGAKDKEDVKSTGLDMDNSQKKFKKRVSVGKTVNYELTKGKAGTHDGITGEFDFSYETLTDDKRSVVVEGIKHGCIFERDGHMTVIRKSTGLAHEGLVDIPGVEGLIKLMEEDFEVELFIRREVMAAAGIRCAYR